MKRARHVLAAVAYVVVALWGMRAVLTAPSVVLPYPADHDVISNFKLVSQADQIKEATGMIRALSLLLDPGRLLDADCHPLPRSIAFGEHMYGEALLAAVPYAITGDPILTFNVVLVLGLVLSGLAMYALAFYWTRDAGAAFLAGLLFLILPARLGDPQHPFCHGDYWIPLFLLFLHRVVTLGRWRDTAVLAVVGSLQCLESAYTLVEFGLVGGVYAIWVAVQYWRRLPAVLPQLVVAAATIGAVALAVLSPFFAIRDVWPPSGRFSMPWPGEILGFGGAMYAGTVAFVLAIVALVDRLLRRRVQGDPRIAMFAAGLLCAWLGTAGLVVVLGRPSWIAFMWLWSQIGHNFAGVRVLPLLMHGVPLAVTFLAAWGAAALTRLLPLRARPVLIGALAIVALVEVFRPDVARVSFGRTVEMHVQDWRPADAALALYDEMDGDGAVLDLPYTPGIGGGLQQLPHYAVARMYHGHRMAACPTSIEGPLEPDVAALGARLPDAAAVDALYALGFRYVVVHDHLLPPRDLARWIVERAKALRSPSFVSLGRVAGHELFELRSASPMVASLDALGSSPTATAVRVQTPLGTVPITFRNTAAGTYRHPDPIHPTPIRMVWRGRNGEPEHVYEQRLLLPIALGPGEELARKLVTAIPEPGSYDVTVAAAANPEHVLGRAAVDVEPFQPPAGAPRP